MCVLSISVNDKRLAVNTKKWTLVRSCLIRVRLVHFWAWRASCWTFPDRKRRLQIRPRHRQRRRNSRWEKPLTWLQRYGWRATSTYIDWNIFWVTLPFLSPTIRCIRFWICLLDAWCDLNSEWKHGQWRHCVLRTGSASDVKLLLLRLQSCHALGSIF